MCVIKKWVVYNLFALFPLISNFFLFPWVQFNPQKSTQFGDTIFGANSTLKMSLDSVIGKKYKLSTSENFEEYMKALGRAPPIHPVQIINH